ncbi:hypothetical protein GCM10018785_40920 [Streptomyces longispororuber]|uniref:Uncharacterized protein n=1 Tax=Streptomyces longispororuber TaxID=68230 RepID=A0A918ZTM8_9ACTN|nr:hypothetical protein [Streptomyces longispororuber]GHE68112.1 hypothetical protein GCM10018785_40920 [Streptomyces longispororuber]
MNGRVVLERFPAGGPRGSWPAEEFARDRRSEGQPAEVVMDLATDAFLVIVRDGPERRGADECSVA